MYIRLYDHVLYKNDLTHCNKANILKNAFSSHIKKKNAPHAG